MTLSPLFSSASNPKDIESIESRIPGGSRRTSPFYSGLTFENSATNSPTITISGSSSPVGNLFMNDASEDEIGIRVTPPNLVFTNGAPSSWIGAGILNKPIGDFSPYASLERFRNLSGAPYFGSIRIGIHQAVIPEPEEYGLVIGLVALFIVIVRNGYLKLKDEDD